MEQLLPFKEIEEIVTTSYYHLYFSEREDTGQRFIIKRFHQLDEHHLVSLRNSVQYAKQLQLELILEPIEFIEGEGEGAIIYKNFEGISLSTLLKQFGKWPPSKFVPIARNIAQLVDGIHSRGWIIRNLCTEHILVNPETFECKLADLRKVSRIYKNEINTPLHETDLKELHYISPEQTGRINQITDHRSDYYSLGIIYFELLAGSLPFKYKDPIEVIHSHLTTPIPALSDLDKDIPKPYSDIVLKLAAKDVKERYQSSTGLMHDLNRADSFLESPASFLAGSKDKVDKIVATSKLIGRKKELEALEKAYQATKAGKKQVVYLSGGSGVGKTRIIEEFYKNNLTDQIPMVGAKFDVFQKATPYSALIDAITQLVDDILKKEDEKIDYWKQRLLSHLKDNAALIIEVIPELEALIGSQPRVNPLPPDEAQIRFQQTFINFIVAFTTGEHTLIFYLDDLQWADIASIRLGEMILMSDQITNLLFIGAYRDNEVDATHPLAISIRKQDQWINLYDIKIDSFNIEDTKELIYNTLYFPVVRQEEFADILYRKSDGNTFYTLQLLTSLFEEQLLFQNEEGHWDWNNELLQQKGASGNVIDFLVSKINNLEPNLQDILKIGACIGDEFDLKILSELSDKKMNHLANDLSVVINQGYVISIDENVNAFFTMISDIDEGQFNSLNNARFKFSHDRIRQAALSLVDKDRLALLNLEAARIKVRNLSTEQLEEELFYLANHFNYGVELITDKSEIKQLVDYNYRAGLKAKNASAYDAAITYFDAAKACTSFDEDYTTQYSIFLNKAECLYLTGDFDQAEKELDILFDASNNNLDKLNSLFLKVYLYQIQERKAEALEAGRIGYSLYNIKMPEKEPIIMALLLKDLMVAKFRLNRKKLKRLLERPIMKDEEKIRFQEFLLAISPTIYQINQKLFAWNVMRMFFATLKDGNNGISSFGYIGYGMLASQLFGQYPLGQKLGELAIDLNNKLGYIPLKWKVRGTYYNFVHHWTQPVRPFLDKILEVETGAFANGDPIFAGYAIFNYHQHKFALGFQLEDLHESFETYLKLAERRGDLETTHFLESYYYAIRCLIGHEPDINLMGSSYDAANRIKETIEQLNYSVAADIYIAYMGLLFIFDYFEEAWQRYREAEQWISFVESRYEFAEYNLYGVLICAMAVKHQLPKSNTAYKLAKKHHKKLKVWSDLCPENFEPQYLLASAALESMRKKSAEVNSLFERAIASADKYKFINYKAIAGELAGKIQYKAGNLIMAKTFLDNSRRDYAKWSAYAKTHHLEDTYKDLFPDSVLEQQKSHPDKALSAGLDLNLVLQANQAIKSTKDVDTLLEQLMDVIIKYSGADKGYLILTGKSEFLVTAKYSMDDGATSCSEYADNSLFPLSLVKYVHRLKKHQILNSPAQTPEYSGNRYFISNNPKSLICYPILKQGEVFGILYLENYQYEKIFSEEKVSVLNLISAQIAVSLDNAFLYENMEQKVLERTKSIEVEKGIVDEMLENILPKASIDELKKTGKTTAQKFEGITVLMADIKGFTRISEILSPDELISRIDHFFSSFDEIMLKYKLERIKTIGDAYMAAGGFLGDPGGSALNMVYAALEMQEFIRNANKDVPENERLDMRIGLNTGPVIAGVVGFKRYQYDIWGDTVNIAARMEQESEAGKINVSETTRVLTSEYIVFENRGKIEGKNKGLMDMYFVKSVIPKNSDQPSG